jgi:choline dehydrogenase-like flavoprotein
VPIERPDAIIVGSGAGGGTAAQVLTSRGFSVVVLEKGSVMTSDDFIPLDELHFREHKTLTPKVVDDPMVYVDAQGTPSDSERWWEANMVGGSTMIWDANFPRYTPEDFAVTQYLAGVPNSGNMVDWPWTYEQFRPYFERAEWMWGVSGDARQSPEWIDSPRYQYPMPPLKKHMATDFLTEKFRAAGLQPYIGARAINSQTYDGRPACSFCGFCQFFGCAVNCRASSANTVLQRALATGRCELRTGHCVTRLIHKNGRIEGVAYKTERSPTAKEHVLTAPLVVVSVQTIQSARLFLCSEIPDPSKMIGRYLTYHAKGDLHVSFKAKPVWDPGADHQEVQPKTAIGSLQLRGFYTYRDTDGTMRKGGKFSVYDPLTCTTPLRLLKGASLSATKKSIWGKDLTAYLAELRAQGGVSFSFTGDAMSLYDNRVEIHPSRQDPWGVPLPVTYYQHDSWEIEASERALTRVERVMVDAGGEVRKREPQGKANRGYGHVHGALRAGSDPGKSALDVNCQCHTVQGLYVLDAAWMPTAGASNPSLTLIANAIRVCDQVPKPPQKLKAR